MSLLQEFQDKTPAGYDDYANHDEIAHEVGAKQVAYDILDTTRWGHVVEYVYQRGDEFVSVTYTSGSGDSEYPYEPDLRAVKPVTKTVVTYEKV